MMRPPKSETELMQRAQRLAGLTLGELAQQYHVNIPTDSVYAKGWSGLLMELLLGTTAGSLAEPDFQGLGVELKTIPINESGKPLESTYVSIVPLTKFIGLQWENSDVFAKLKRILWVPLAAGKLIPLAKRQVGMPFLWSPTPQHMLQLKQDWQELMDRVALGELEKISSHMGKYLQIRPKAANGASRCWGIDSEGNRILVLPRGFYLRTCFTQMILNQYLEIISKLGCEIQ